jgi:hypothetical protein
MPDFKRFRTRADLDEAMANEFARLVHACPAAPSLQRMSQAVTRHSLHHSAAP